MPGEILNEGIPKPTEVEVNFTSISSFTQVSLDEMEENEINPEEEVIKTVKKRHKVPRKTMKTIDENEEDLKTMKLPQNEVAVGSNEIKIENTQISMEKSVSSVIKENKNSIKNDSSQADVEKLIHKCFQEWISLETLIFIHGEEKIKTKLNSDKLSDCFELLKISELRLEQQKKYMEICKKLHLKELAEEKFDRAVVGNTALKPLPDFDDLRKELKEQDLKVKSFYSGTIHVKEDPNFPTKKQESDYNEGPPVVLPLVDSNSQVALRRKIFLNSLNKT